MVPMSQGAEHRHYPGAILTVQKHRTLCQVQGISKAEPGDKCLPPDGSTQNRADYTGAGWQGQHLKV